MENEVEVKERIIQILDEMSEKQLKIMLAVAASIK